MKTCSCCGEEKPLADFYKNKGECKVCVQRKAKHLRALMTAEVRAERASKQRAYSRTPAGKATQHRSHIKLRYGITQEQYDKMLADQGGCCALCPNEISPYGRRLSVDHDHQTGRVRGILCLRCNNQIALLERVGVEGVLAYLAADPLGPDGVRRI